MSKDKDQVQMGIEVEKEHAPTVKKIREALGEDLDISNEEIYQMIAEDHLKEFPDYYTRLKKMETQQGGGEVKTKRGSYIRGVV